MVVWMVVVVVVVVLWRGGGGSGSGITKYIFGIRFLPGIFPYHL